LSISFKLIYNLLYFDYSLYRWVIAISSLLIHFLMDGVTYSLGTFLTSFTEEYNVSYAEASFVHSLLPAVTYMSGPIASIFTNKYGCRATTIIGAFIAFLGFFLSFFVRNFYLLYITIGLIAGKF
jgi:MFS family permease